MTDRLQRERHSRRHPLLVRLGAAFTGLALATAFGSARPVAAAEVWPGTAWASTTPQQAGLDPARLNQAISYGKARGGSGIVVRNGYRVAGWGDQARRYGLLSSTKSFGSLLLGLAVDDGRVRLDSRAAGLLPGFGLPPESNRSTGWLPLVTLGQLATHSAGFGLEGGFEPVLFRPGTAWAYSNSGANWLADVLTGTYRRDLAAVLRERVLSPLQIGPQALTWRANAYRPGTLNGVARREFASGIYASVEAMARVGLLAARGGRWKGRQVLSASYARSMGRTWPGLSGLAPRDAAKFPAAPRHYGLLWWNNNDGAMAGVPRDAFWSWGKGESFILVVPSLDLVAARAGPAWQPGSWGSNYNVLKPFFAPLAQSVVR